MHVIREHNPAIDVKWRMDARPSHSISQSANMSYQ